MNVLLISPIDPKVPSNLKLLMGGENTFTQSLLNYPPKGVNYIHFNKALEKGYIELTFWQKIFSYLTKFRILPLSPGVMCFKLNKQFDLIHSHAYAVKLENSKCPVILSDSSSNFLFLRDYLNWSLTRIKFGYWIKKTIYRKLDVIDQDVNLHKAYKLIVFSKFAKKIHEELSEKQKKIVVIYPGLPSKKIISHNNSKINILFAGVWFERKGGTILLKSYQQLKEKYKNLKLTVLGPLPKKVSINDSTIIQKDFVSYDKLINDYYPKADIFVLAPPKTEGFGMVVLEAMSFGIPVVVSSVYALPELIINGKTGLVVKPSNVEDLTKKLEKLILNTKLRKKMGTEAKKEFNKRFSIKKRNKDLLLNAYLPALATSPKLQIYRKEKLE